MYVNALPHYGSGHACGAWRVVGQPEGWNSDWECCYVSDSLRLAGAARNVKFKLLHMRGPLPAVLDTLVEYCTYMDSVTAAGSLLLTEEEHLNH
jgi:hypothetical protein